MVKRKINKIGAVKGYKIELNRLEVYFCKSLSKKLTLDFLEK